MQTAPSPRSTESTTPEETGPMSGPASVPLTPTRNPAPAETSAPAASSQTGADTRVRQVRVVARSDGDVIARPPPRRELPARTVALRRRRRHPQYWQG